MSKFKVDFIGIGAEKAATYWVAAILKEHPEVCFSDRKEIAFFNEFDQHFLLFRNPRYDWGIDWYKKYFAHCKKGKVMGEYTPTYLYSKRTAERIKKHFPGVKLIVSLRDPVERAHSQFIHDQSIGLIGKISFEEALNRYRSYVEKSLYYKHLKAYFDLFPKQNILVLFLEDIKKDPQKVATKVYRFLKLKKINFVPPSLEKRFNVATKSRFWLLNYFLIQTEYFLRRNRLYFIFRFLEDSGIRRFLFLLSYHQNRKPLTNYPKMSSETMSKLRKVFKKDVEELEKLLGRNLSNWE